VASCAYDISEGMVAMSCTDPVQALRGPYLATYCTSMNVMGEECMLSSTSSSLSSPLPS